MLDEEACGRTVREALEMELSFRRYSAEPYRNEGAVRSPVRQAASNTRMFLSRPSSPRQTPPMKKAKRAAKRSLDHLRVSAIDLRSASSLSGGILRLARTHRAA